LLLQPQLSFVVLALGAVAIATGMILVLGLTTGLTSIDLPSQERGATAFNGAHRLAVAGQYLVPILGSILGSVTAKDVGNLYHVRSAMS
jgi:hypothetical protein